ncbi:MAG: FAD-dependent oxidoreductase [Candidatus Aerophobetes bacterium]
MKKRKIGSVLVIGGGIGGVQAALDLAESGYKVYLLDQRPAIGGTMAQLDKTFPTNDCSMCILAPKLVDAGRHQNIEIITMAEVDKIEGEPGMFKVRVKKNPRFVDESKCTGCGSCWNNCPVRNIPQPEEKEIVKPELEQKDLEKITKLMGNNKNGRRTLVPLLQDTNAEYRYLPENILKYISDELDIPLSQIYSIATFYNAFSLTPRGRYVISVCLGTACHVRGGQKIMESLERDLRIKVSQTTSDLNFTLEAVHCLGCCGLAPVVTIGDDLYGKMNQVKIQKTIKKYKG